MTTGAPTISRQAVVDFSYPVIYVDAAIIVPFPREESKIWLETVGFQRTVNDLHVDTLCKKLIFFS